MQGYHWKDGWYFTRLLKGEVNVRHVFYGDDNEAICDRQFTIPAEEWASIVCNVSNGGQTKIRYEVAQRFHGKETINAEKYNRLKAKAKARADKL